MPVWHPGLTQQQNDALDERIQKRVCRIIMGCYISDLRQRREKICLDFTNSLLNSNEFRNWLPNRRSVDTNYMSLRNSEQLSVPRSRTHRYSQSTIPYIWSKFGINSSIINFNHSHVFVYCFSVNTFTVFLCFIVSFNVYIEICKYLLQFSWLAAMTIF